MSTSSCSCFLFPPLLSFHPPSSSSSSSPLYLGVSCLIALERRGDPASWLMVTPPQLVTSKRGHCSFCSPLMLNFSKLRSLLQGKAVARKTFDVLNRKLFNFRWVEWLCYLLHPLGIVACFDHISPLPLTSCRSIGYLFYKILIIRI